jgi:hypothetical protein
MAIWKGDGIIKESVYSDAAYFETPEQFAPVFIVTEIRNDGPSAAQVTSAGRDEKPVQLALDRRNYRISLDWRGQIKPRQVSRFALSLAAEKSSHHVLKLVLALADGIR